MSWRTVLTVAIMFLATLAAFKSPVAAEDISVGSREELARALDQARPGTTILVAPGRYRGGLSSARLRGTPEAPIVIAAADVRNPPVLEGGTSGFQLSSPAHVEIRNLVFSGATGNGLNIDDSGDVRTAAHDVVLRGLIVRDVGPEGNRDGIKLSGLRSFRVEDCTVERWGSGGSGIDMVGCQNGIVSGCTFREATGDAANGVQAKGGSSEIIIRRCRFQNVGGRGVNLGGSTGLPYFRPLEAPYEARQITVEDCEFLGGMAAVAYVGVDGALVQHNVIYCPTHWVVRILQENTAPRFVASRNGRFERNVVVFRSDTVRTVVNVGGNTDPATFSWAGNVWCCEDAPERTERLVQRPGPEIDGVYDVRPRFQDAEQGLLTLVEPLPHKAGVRPIAEAE